MTDTTSDPLGYAAALLDAVGVPVELGQAA